MKHPFHVGSFDKSLLLVVVAFIAIIIQVMDKSFGTTFTLSLRDIFPRADLLVFGLMILISIAIQSVLIKKAREAVKIDRSKSRVGQTVLVVTALLQYSAADMLVIILFQAVFTLKYSVNLLETIVGINLITSSVILAILSSRFVRTLRY
jgi:hypothetical protein